MTLSGGQRQRVAIARALLKDPPILVLDDALSAVDTRTESEILTALDERRARHTTLIVTHRLASVTHADRICVLQEGRVVESGDHAELMRRGRRLPPPLERAARPGGRAGRRPRPPPGTLTQPALMNASNHEEEEYSQDLEWSLWRRVLAYTLRRPGQVLLFALAGSLVGAVDIGLPLVTRVLVDQVVAGEPPQLLRYGVIYALLGLALAGGVLAFIELGGRVYTRVAYDIREDAFSNLQELSFSFFDHRPIGWLMARMTSDCERLSNIMAWGLLDLAWGLTIMLGSALVMLSLNATLAAITLSVIPVLAWVSVWFQRRILRTSRQVRKTKLTADRLLQRGASPGCAPPRCSTGRSRTCASSASWPARCRAPRCATSCSPPSTCPS